ncbi:LytR/AlgR family response regulator transcription factor [Gemmatimonas sp.]|uniref:LytR/AlgR family response regulator transcription factor n=1 Tax=Gemmatimonas sp. TaxID=1962908 RepID=UPI0037BF4892
MPCTVMIVDDEPLARQRLRDLLKSREGFEIVAECEDGPTALTSIANHNPDVVLLDIQMPGMDGIRVAEQLREPRPAVIFVTAFDQHAVRAFDVHAMDYVLKPFEPERLFAAMDRARQATEKSARAPADWKAMLRELRSAPAWLTRVAIRLGDRIYYIRMADVDWIEAEGNYVRLHTGAKSHLLRRALRQLAEELDPTQFARIHRSSIVSIDRITEFRATPDGDYHVLLSTGTKLKMLRKYRDALP